MICTVKVTTYVALGAGDNFCHVIIAGLEFIFSTLFLQYRTITDPLPPGFPIPLPVLEK